MCVIVLHNTEMQFWCEMVLTCVIIVILYLLVLFVLSDHNKWLMPLATQQAYLLLVLYNVKPRLKCSLGLLARLSTLS